MVEGMTSASCSAKALHNCGRLSQPRSRAPIPAFRNSGARAWIRALGAAMLSSMPGASARARVRAWPPFSGVRRPA
ncbi:hypothetical protein SL103_17445 [Streptomyces lydicus]|uniref:Uncharacterized protein n=1 Tax=Streptomyces lydicus TaxID=47763 RepID=A0A1D7VM38_9ACTN|nr:hypothetical protein SL103_17445 [Streptomyces lydicus]